MIQTASTIRTSSAVSPYNPYTSLSTRSMSACKVAALSSDYSCFFRTDCRKRLMGRVWGKRQQQQ
ncbi:MAG: hypothetical protein IT258_00620 [Saprospiraceae bacterium]|nr:hypothetical protein [Saprospiraceae bacterium]